jgi:hypothetical protein
LVFKSRKGCGLAKSLVIQSHLRSKHIAGVKARALVLQPPKGLNQKRSSNKQNARERNFGDNQQALQSRSRAAGACPPDTFMQSVSKLSLGTLQSGRQTKDNAGNECDGKREGPHVPIYAHLTKPRQVLRTEPQQQRQQARGCSQPEAAARYRKKAALNQELAGQAKAACTQSQSNRHLFASRCRTAQ